MVAVVYAVRIGKGSFENIEELNSSIGKNLKKISINIDVEHKALNQFLPWCRKFVVMEGGLLKHFFR